MKKGVIIGFDGAPFKMIDKFLKEDKLPFFSKIYKEGAFGVLESVIPAYTMIAWPCFYTGKNPAKIGPFLIKSKGFDPSAFAKSFFVNSTDIKTWTIWEYLSHLGYKVGVMNVPVTYPPKKVKGFLITDFLTPKGAENFAYPPELTQKLKDYRISPDLDIGRYGHPDSKVDLEKMKKDLTGVLKEHGEWALKLIKEYSPDFFIINFKELDDFMHFFYGDEEKILEVYKIADSYTQKIYELLNPDIFVIMSDHGFHKVPRTYFYINSFLEKKGYLKRAKTLKGRASISIYKLGEKVLRIMPFLRNLIPEKAKYKVAREHIIHRIDWDNSKCFANWYAGVYFNEKFFRTQEERKKFAEQIKKDFLNLKDEKGRKVFKIVHTKYELFKGPYFDLMPEVVYTTEEDFRINPNLADKLFDVRIDRPDLKGHHHADMDGIFFIKAEKIKKKVYEKKIKLYDIFPTFLYLLGEKIPDDVDGKIPEILFKERIKPDFVSIPYRGAEEYEMKDEEAESVKKHLKGLGYI